jgi:uncharacterized protein YecE (DUF72 family)
VADEAWQRFSATLEPLRQAGKLGAILLRFPPWFPISRARKDYIVSCAARAAPDRVCVEFRNQTWMTPENQDETPLRAGLAHGVGGAHACLTPRDRALFSGAAPGEPGSAPK